MGGAEHVNAQHRSHDVTECKTVAVSLNSFSYIVIYCPYTYTELQGVLYFSLVLLLTLVSACFL